MERFHVVDDAAVIIRSKGVYRQSKVYRRDDKLYAGYGVGFIKLYGGSGGTSHPSISWIDIDLPLGFMHVVSGFDLALVETASPKLVAGE